MTKRNGEASEAAEVQSRAELPEEMQGLIDVDTLDTKTYYYRLVQDRPQNMARKRVKGYEPVLAEEEGVKLLTGEVSADGLIRDGDTVLMRIPKARRLAGRKKLAKFTEDRLSAPVQNFVKKTKGAGPGGVDIKVDTNTELKED